MHGEDGRALLPRLRDALGYLPSVALCTGDDAAPGDHIRAVVRKPFEPAELVALIASLTGC